MNTLLPKWQRRPLQTKQRILAEDRELLPTDIFFELGGQSILLLRAHS